MKENIRTLTSKKSLFGGLIDDSFVLGLAIALLITLGFNLFFRSVIVRGISMEPTFRGGDFLIVDRRSDIERGDIVVFRQDGEYLIKRVIAVGGDELSSEDGQVVVNGKKMGKGKAEKQVIPEGSYYVMGDNRDNSFDSRDFGPVDSVLGEVAVRIFPAPSKEFPME